MAEKKTDNLKVLRGEIECGEPSTLYVFHGEERYLLEYWLGELKKKLVPEGFEEFNLFAFDGGGLSFDTLQTAAEALPVFSEYKLVIVTDLNLYKPPADMKAPLEELLSDIPDGTVLVFIYDVVEFKPDARTAMHKLLQKHALTVEFQLQDVRELVAWLKRRFRALSKIIDSGEAEHMLFVCGHSMTTLTLEVEKVAAYSATEKIAKSDIDAVCEPVIDAVVYNLTDAAAQGRYDLALSLLKDLTSAKNEPIVILAALGRQFRQLFAARVATDERRGEKFFSEVAGIRTPFIARKLIDMASRLTTDWCAEAVTLCAECDYALKRSSSDRSSLLEMLLLRLAALRQ